MATGLAIMGFGGGAMIGAPLADKLMKHFATATSIGAVETFIVLGVVYFVFMMGGALGYRLAPDAGSRPPGTPRLPWLVLMLNVSAGIGILSLASPLLRDGMNLVAKEFVAAQDPDNPGVLVLSDRAGAAGELTDALLVNPYDIGGIAVALK
jgi:hypothetical protein